MGSDNNDRTKRYRKEALLAAISVFVVVVLLSCRTTSPSDTTSPMIQSKRTSPFFASIPPTPAIVWLMALPHSGSSFCWTLVSRACGNSMATNYGGDVTQPNNASLSINPRESIGPYWAGLGATKRKLPTTNVLTLTYCRTKSTPYVPTLDEYLQDCLTTFGRTYPDFSVLTQHSYPASRVNKAIHLVRNPLTQVLAKFQKEYTSNVKDKKWTDEHPNTDKAFITWCREEDSKRSVENTEFFDAETVKLMSDTVCSVEISQFILWHNRAFETCLELNIPQLVVYHEDLLDDMVESTLDRMLDFLQLSKQEMPTDRLMGKTEGMNVSQYLSLQEQKQIGRLVQLMAIPQTWQHVQHYFQDL